MSKAKLAVLVSGQGSNLSAIIEACKNPSFPAFVQIVVSDKRQAPALKIAMAQAIPTIVIDPKIFKTKTEFDQMLITTFKQYQVDLICLAGFMRLLSPLVVQAFSKKILNIHPSLLPAFPGLNSVKEALEAGIQETGCSTHYVDEGVDTGPIILQARVPIFPGDTQDSLHERIKQEEHKLYPKTIEQVLLENNNFTL